MSDESFKVVDKRGFDKSGEKRSPEEKAEGEKAETKEKPEAAKKPNEDENERLGEDSGVDFQGFVMGLMTQTMVMLGEMPHPETGLVAANLEAAKQTIDLLALIEEKTVGNLTKDEERLIQDVLASLRIAYVKKVKGN